MAARFIYEIQVCRANNWTVQATFDDKGQAIKSAQSALAKVDAVKVLMKEAGRTLGNKGKVVFEQERNLDALTIQSIENAPPCETVEAFYAYPARRCAGKLLRRYLDEMGITALELVHNKFYLKVLTRHDTLFSQAVSRVGSLQAKDIGVKPQDRISQLYEMAEEIVQRSEEFEEDRGPFEKLQAEGLSAVMASGSEEERVSLGRRAMADLLGTKRDWMDKTELLVEQLANNDTPEAVKLLDETLAEILDGSKAIMELLGAQPDLFAAIESLLQLQAGRFERHEGAATPLARLNRFFEERDLPKSRAVMLERAIREISSINPLTREGGEVERTAFIALVREIQNDSGIVGGPAMAEALIQRGRLALAQYGQTLTSKDAMDQFMVLLPTRAVILGFLLDLANTPTGQKQQEALLMQLSSIMNRLPSITKLVPIEYGRMRTVEAAKSYLRRLKAAKIPDADRKLLLAKLDELMKSYFNDSGQVEHAPGLAPSLAASAAATPDSAAEAKPSEGEQPTTASEDAAVEADGSTTAEATPAVRTAEGGEEQTTQTQEKAEATQGEKAQMSSKPSLEKRTFGPGEVIFSQEDPGNEAYYVTSGRVEVLMTSGNEQTRLASVGRGSFLGEMALVDDHPRMASATAVEETTVTVIPMQAFKKRLDRLEQFDPMLRRLLDVFVDRIRVQTRKAAGASRLDV
ncbi:MAG: cyclic nucleotide-binding domain-containing protein [Pseudomonadota bacterium]